jgi:hypothetical protein
MAPSPCLHGLVIALNGVQKQLFFDGCVLGQIKPPFGEDKTGSRLSKVYGALAALDDANSIFGTEGLGGHRIPGVSGLAEAAADLVIAVMNLATGSNVNLAEAIVKKQLYNRLCGPSGKTPNLNELIAESRLLAQGEKEARQELGLVDTYDPRLTGG